MSESQNRQWCLLLAPLFEYPDAAYVEHVRFALAGCPPAARDQLTRFLAEVASLPLAALEESFIQAFDLNPDCALDIGWHLFGEDYARGEFLIKLKGEHRRYGVDERSELPDHLPAVLRLLAAMSGEEEAGRLARQFLAPAVSKIRSNFKEPVQPLACLLDSLAACLVDAGYSPAAEEVLHE